MNFMDFIKRGAAHAPSDAQRQRAKIEKAAEQQREKWRDALIVDATRAWLNIGEKDPGVIDGFVTMLAIAGFAYIHDHGQTDSPDIRIIRGAMSAAAQCAESGCKMTEDAARAMGIAARRADAIVIAASINAIIFASQKIREAVGIT